MQGNFVAHFLQVKCYFRRKTAVLHFRASFGDLGTTYYYQLRFIGKQVADFLLLLIELFSLGFTAKALLANSGSKSAISLQWGRFNQNFSLFQVEGVAPTNHSSSQKTRLNDLLYGIKIWTIFFLRFC